LVVEEEVGDLEDLEDPVDPVDLVDRWQLQSGSNLGNQAVQGDL